MVVTSIQYWGFDRGGHVVLVLEVSLEHPLLGLLEHVGLPILIDLDAGLVLPVEYDGIDDVSHLSLLVHHVLVVLALGFDLLVSGLGCQPRTLHRT